MIIILGALPILKGAVPVLARGLEHTAPTYAVGSRIDKTRTACAARHLKHPIAMSCLADQKSQLRKAALIRRDGLDEVSRIEKSLAAGDHALSMDLFDEDHFIPGTVVSGFLPIRSEIDPRPLMFALAKRGARLCVPVVKSKTIIEFRELVRDAPLVESGFGTLGPDDSACVLDPHIMIVPLSVYDENGGRIGYGGGYYDRAIDRLVELGITPYLLGMGFSIQKVGHVPMETHDRYLNSIATETGHHTVKN